ncbi:MAG: hypothetical protein WB566_00875 [Terriglobales bacterium]
MRKVLIPLIFILPASVTWLSCGGTPTASPQTSGVKYRAFITNNVSAGSTGAGIYIVDASLDVRAPGAVISAGSTPGMMVVTPNHAQTLVFSGNGTQFSDNTFSVINNASEGNAAHLTLPGMTESFVVSPDSSAAYIAIPTAPVVGQSPGIVQVISLNSGSVSGQAEVPGVHYLSINHGGNRILGFSEGTDAVADTVAVITPSNIGIPNASAVNYIGGPGIFDHPVAAFFSSDDSTAYILSCGAECGGMQAGVQQYNMVTNTLVASLPLCTSGANPQCAGSEALVNGSTMYVAGTPMPAAACTGQTTAAQSCGLLNVVDLSTMTLTTSGIAITDGYHNRIALGANGQLFIGASDCTEIVPPVPTPPGTETRGCLTIYNTLSTAVGGAPAGGVVISPANGDVTGIEPIGTRQVVYVVQGGSLDIYDDTIDALEYNPNNPNNPGKVNALVGNFIDVKTVDF